MENERLIEQFSKEAAMMDEVKKQQLTMFGLLIKDEQFLQQAIDKIKDEYDFGGVVVDYLAKESLVDVLENVDSKEIILYVEEVLGKQVY